MQRGGATRGNTPRQRAPFLQLPITHPMFSRLTTRGRRSRAALHRLTHAFAFALLALSLTQCREDVDELTVETDPLPEPVELTTVALAGTATAPGGAPAAGATIEVVYGDRVLETTTAGADGAWSLPEARVAADAPSVTVRTRYPGAYSVVRSVPRDPSTTYYASAQLTALEGAIVQDAAQPIALSAAGLSVEAPGAALTLSGATYTGEVNLAIASFEFQSQAALPLSVAAPYVALDESGTRLSLRHETIFAVEATSPTGEVLGLRSGEDAAAVTVQLSGDAAGAELFHFDHVSGTWSRVTPDADGALRVSGLGYFATGEAVSGETLVGRVVDASGTGLPGQTVIGFPGEDSSFEDYLFLETDGEGRYTAIVPDESAILFLAGFRACGFDFEVYRSGDGTIRDLVTSAGTSFEIAGRVDVCDGGSPISNTARVTVTVPSGNTQDFAVSADGTFGGPLSSCREGDLQVVYRADDGSRGEEVTVAFADATDIVLTTCEGPAPQSSNMLVDLDGTILFFASETTGATVDDEGVLTLTSPFTNGDDDGEGEATMTLTPLSEDSYEVRFSFTTETFSTEGASGTTIPGQVVIAGGTELAGGVELSGEVANAVTGETTELTFYVDFRATVL